MPKKDRDEYNLCMNSIILQTDKRSKGYIDNRIRKANISLKRLHAAAHGEEQANELNSVVDFFVDGFLEIVKKYNLKNHNYLSIFTSDYTAAFNSSIDEQFDEVRFDYQINRRGGKPILEICSEGMAFDLFIENYEFALKIPDEKDPSYIPQDPNYNIHIYTDQFVEEGEEYFGTKQILLELLL